MIDIANGPEWLSIVIASFILGYIVGGLVMWKVHKDREKQRKSEKNGGDTPKGGAL